MFSFIHLLWLSLSLSSQDKCVYVQHWGSKVHMIPRGAEWWIEQIKSLVSEFITAKRTHKQTSIHKMVQEKPVTIDTQSFISLILFNLCKIFPPKENSQK